MPSIRDITLRALTINSTDAERSAVAEVLYQSYRDTKYEKWFSGGDENIMRADARNLVDIILDNNAGEVWTATLTKEDEIDDGGKRAWQAVAIWTRPGSDEHIDELDSQHHKLMTESARAWWNSDSALVGNDHIDANDENLNVKDDCHLQTIATIPSARSQGLATALQAKWTEIAKAAGQRYSVVADSEALAAGFFSKAGLVERVRGQFSYPDGTKEPMIMMTSHQPESRVEESIP